MTDQPRSARPPWRRLAKFCGLALIVFLVVLAGSVAWLKWRAHEQRDAVAAIKAARGTVEYDWEAAANANPVTPSSLPSWAERLIHWNSSTDDAGEIGPAGPRWLVWLLGVDCFGDVTAATLPHRASPDLFHHVGRLKRLETLRIQASDLSDREMALIGGLR